MLQYRLTKDRLRRLKFLKYEFYLVFLKTLYKNSKTSKNKKMFYWFYFKQTKYTQSKKRNFCLLSGRGRGIWRISNISRHNLNKRINEGYIINYTAYDNK